MVSRIETYCKLLASSSRLYPSSSGLQITQNRISTPNGNSWNDFAKVFNADTKNTTELYNATCIPLTQCFMSGYNASLLLLGTGECLQGLLTDPRGPFVYLTEHIAQVTGKQLKNKASSTSRVSVPVDKQSLPYLNVKDNVLMRVYLINKDEIQDLSHGRQSASYLAGDREPCMEHDFSTGYMVQNLRGFSLVDNSSKESCKHLVSSLRHIDLINSTSDEICLVVEYVMTKRSDGTSAPQTSCLRIVLLVTNESISHKLDTICDEGFFQDKLLNQSSMDTLTLHLSDAIGGNCVTKAISFMDGVNSTATETLLKISNGLKNVSNYPVLVTPVWKSLVTKYHDIINKLKHERNKSRNNDKSLLEQLEKRLVRSEQAYKDVCADKDMLVREMQELSVDYQELIARNEAIASEKSESTTANLKTAKELVDLKLKGSSQQQAYYQQLDALKKQANNEQDKADTFQRALRLERKLHEDLKQKYTKLKECDEGLNEEYLNLKVNLHNMVDKFDDQNNHIRDQEKAMSDLLQGKNKMERETNTNVYQQKKKFVEHLLRLSSIFAGREAGINSSSDIDDVIRDLETKINTWKEINLEKETQLKECRRQVAERITAAEIFEDENTSLKHRSSELEKTLERLSKDYQQRLENYIQNIKEFIANNTADVNDNLQSEAVKMTSSKKSAISNDLERLKENLQQVQQEKTVLMLKFKKITIAYRQLCEKNEKFDVLIPTDDDVEIFQTKKQFELEEQLKSAQIKIQKLQAKLEVLGEMQNNRSNPVLNDVKSIKKIFAPHSQSRDFQVAVEREKADLLSRCIMAEQEVETITAIKDQQIESLQDEVAYLRHYIQQSSQVDLPHLPSVRFDNRR